MAASGLDVYWYWPHPASPSIELAMELARRGHRLTVESLATRFGESLVSDADATLPYRAVRDLPEAPARRERTVGWIVDRAGVYLARARRRRRAVATGRFDAIYLQTLNQFTDAIAVRDLRRRAPVTAFVHDVRPHNRRLPVAVETTALRGLYRGLDGIFVSHRWMADQLVADFGVEPERVAVVGMQIPERFQGSNAPVPIPRASGEPLRVLCFGVLRRNKGIEHLIDAVASLPPEVELRVRIAGRGPDDMEALVRAACARDGRIAAEVGFVAEDRKDELYRSADLVVLPYASFASQSAVLADAYAYRVPVLVTDVGSLGPTVRADASGWVVPARDPVALRDTLARAVDAPGDLARFRAAISGLVPSLRMGRVVDEMEAVFAAVTNDRGARPR